VGTARAEHGTPRTFLYRTWNENAKPCAPRGAQAPAQSVRGFCVTLAAAGLRSRVSQQRPPHAGAHKERLSALTTSVRKRKAKKIFTSEMMATSVSTNANLDARKTLRSWAGPSHSAAPDSRTVICPVELGDRVPSKKSH